MLRFHKEMMRTLLLDGKEVKTETAFGDAAHSNNPSQKGGL
jgi:hypothetical protein